MKHQLHLRPVGHRLIVELTDINTDGNSLIHVPESFKDKPVFGIVRGVGSRVTEFEGQVGDTVMFDKYSGNTVEGFPNILIMHERNILGIYASKDT